MDFGEILKKWESQKTVVSKKPAQVMETWLKNNEVYNKDAHEEKAQIPGEKRRRLLSAKPDGVLDIHGYTKDKAWALLEQFFNNAKRCGYEKLRVIHGKGNHSQKEAVLGSTVRKFIELCDFAGESGYENAKNGGTGAVWVLLK